ncbi:proprotein convertase subtilisin/kexin type 5-like [Branchiostoma floridae]|uniref:Proprotein convertase subtilisin/kexin type 5-like n=1 Tax=Branchiostoma floridae TaxID=7739 RepID=A0A9J7MEJ3_BRAFL|nr:proprotein convertase subtilisin/kexin type 5-like [Branchiostoma floridae]
MRLQNVAVLLTVLAGVVTSRDPLYSNEWAVQVEGGQEEAVRLADKHGFTYGGKIFGDYHLLRHSHVSRRSTSDSHEKHYGLLKENSDAALSTDVVDGDRDPSHPADSTGHGTKVAGVATAVANNSLCGVGVAPAAKVGVMCKIDFDMLTE